MAVVFTVQPYRRPNGKCPTEDALLEFEHVSPKLRSAVQAGIKRIQYRAYHSGKLTEHIGGDVWCLRIQQGNNIARLFFTFTRGARIWLLNGYVKKDDRMRANPLAMAKTLAKEVQAYA